MVCKVILNQGQHSEKLYPNKKHLHIKSNMFVIEISFNQIAPSFDSRFHIVVNQFIVLFEGFL